MTGIKERTSETDISKYYDNRLAVFEQLESEVRSYCRSFPTVFHRAKGYKLWNTEGREYIDFLSGAGALNYGHNNQQMKEKIIDYLMEDRVTHSLDMATTTKESFLLTFNEVILQPRGLNYKVMFPGPTGTNAVESALKIARKVTGRENIICFSNAFHGMSVGSLSVSANPMKRAGAGIPLHYAQVMPYDQYLGEEIDTADYLEQMLERSGSGISLPAAIILETVQGEGGLNAASFSWLRKIESICKRFNILLIVDDIQAGCGRTGTFFSFEPAGIKPDIICLSKSISGYGLPMALTLIKPEYDQWTPGEHNGTFRGNNIAFLTASVALSYWQDDKLEKSIQEKSKIITHFLKKLVEAFPELKGVIKGRGFMQGIACQVQGLAAAICAEAFSRGLIMETSGPNDEVFKLFPPLTIDQKGLEQGLAIIEDSVRAVVKSDLTIN